MISFASTSNAVLVLTPTHPRFTFGINKGVEMRDMIECPECGGPIVNGGGDDIRCTQCGLTWDEFVDVADDLELLDGDDILLDDELVDGESEGYDSADW